MRRGQISFWNPVIRYLVSRPRSDENAHIGRPRRLALLGGHWDVWRIRCPRCTIASRLPFRRITTTTTTATTILMPGRKDLQYARSLFEVDDVNIETCQSWEGAESGFSVMVFDGQTPTMLKHGGSTRGQATIHEGCLSRNPQLHVRNQQVRKFRVWKVENVDPSKCSTMMNRRQCVLETQEDYGSEAERLRGDVLHSRVKQSLC